MNKLEPKDVYVPVSVAEGKPKNAERYFVETKDSDGSSYSKRATFFSKPDRWADDSFNDNEKVTHFLEKQSAYILSKEELKELIEQSYKKGFTNCLRNNSDGHQSHIVKNQDIDEFINSLFEQ